MKKPFCLVCALMLLLGFGALRAEDGYRLWLRYDRIANDTKRAADAAAVEQIIFATPDGKESPVLGVARDELSTALGSLLGLKAEIEVVAAPPITAVGDEGYSLQTGL